MLAVDSWHFRNMTFMRKFIFSKKIVQRRKMRKNDIKESELNGHTYESDGTLRLRTQDRKNDSQK